MNRNKGISMITLVITIICMILFLGIAYRIGSRYISESKEEERNVLVSVLSSAVTRRQNDKYIGFADKLFYVGYYLPEADFDILYESFVNKDNMYDPGLWYLLDAKKASELGVSNPEQYLINDLSNPKNTKNKYVGVVDYFTGNVELLAYADETHKDTFDGVAKNQTDDENGCSHEGTVTVVSCTEPSVCTKCGKVLAQALGHNPNLENATCTEDKKCTRCGYIIEKALGHEYDTTTLSYDDTGHFNKCVRFEQCHSKGNFEEHSKQYLLIPDSGGSIIWKHNVMCKEADCDWVKEEECTISYRTVNITSHLRYCTNCGKEELVEHDKIKYRYLDKDKHMVYCDTCKSDLYEENHVDIVEPYGICDKCGGISDIENAPVLSTLTMENITDGIEDRYWAKENERIRITLTSTVILSGPPTIKVQNQVIKPESIVTVDHVTYTAEINTNEYLFEDGLLSISVENIRSMWGMPGENVNRTTDDKYIYYDTIPPEYIFIPE